MVWRWVVGAAVLVAPRSHQTITHARRDSTKTFPKSPDSPRPILRELRDPVSRTVLRVPPAVAGSVLPWGKGKPRLPAPAAQSRSPPPKPARPIRAPEPPERGSSLGPILAVAALLCVVLGVGIGYVFMTAK